MNYWLFKSEPETFSIDDLMQRPNQTEHWDGVRNYQVRNMLRDQIKKNDLAFFYHSSCTPPGIVGIMQIVSNGYPDHTAPGENWYMVDVKFIKKFPRMITLEEIKNHPMLKHMQIAKRGNRLSITPVNNQEWDIICNSLIS